MSDTEPSSPLFYIDSKYNVIHNYSTGVPRRHHNLYIEDGNLVFQVENAIFKVHRSFLTKSSTVIKHMLEAPQSGDLKEATDENPLILQGDSASGWETFLESRYDCPHFDPDMFNGRRLLLILPIAHKYCMETIEGAIIKQLKRLANSTVSYVDLMVASQLLDSKPLYNEALQALRSVRPKPDFAQASRIGFRAYFEVVENDLRCTRICSGAWNACPACKQWR